MKDFVVSRHAGTVAWARELMPHATFIESVDLDDVAQGDRVFGVLPFDLAAEVCGRGAQFFALVFDRCGVSRGSELSVDDLRARNPRFVEFKVERVGDPIMSPVRKEARRKSGSTKGGRSPRKARASRGSD